MTHKKPTKLAKLEGNPGKRPLNDNEPQPLPGAPAMPKWLMAEAKEEWRRVVPELARMGLLTIVDRAALVGYCQSYARYVQHEQICDKEGTVMLTNTGYKQQQPETTLALKYLAMVKSFCAEFGLTPSSRARMTLPSEKQADSFDKLLDYCNESTKKTNV